MNPDSPHFASSNLEQDTALLAPGEVLGKLGKGKAERGGSGFTILISHLLRSWVLASVSGSEPTRQMEPFTPPSCLVYTRHDAQKPRQKTFLAESVKLSDILLTLQHCSCDLGPQKNPLYSSLCIS